MRQREFYEAYLDDFDKIIVYMSKASYDGTSNHFYLRGLNDDIVDLHIQSIETTSNNYNRYTLRVMAPITIGAEYYVVHQHARYTALQYSGIVKTAKFDELFFYSGDDLGYTYSNEVTTFALWAPTASRVRIEIAKHGVQSSYEMVRGDSGVFRYAVFDNLENATYHYMVRVNGKWQQSIDPYGIASSANSEASAVVDIHKLRVNDYPLPAMKSVCDAIVYEASVRDFTMQRGIGVQNAGKFAGFVEENEMTKQKLTGFSYLKSLDITHVQLMPVMDFGSVDEVYPMMHYNWGYDPVQYRTLEGSYSNEPYNPYDRMFGFVKLVEECHKAGIRVNLDVVFNHVYDKDIHPFELCVPNYYFQMNEQGDFSNGTYCGNDIDSKRKMCSKYIVDTCRYIVKTYHIDGFRFDLMGILDYETMNQVEQVCKSLNPDFMVYGEGWDMPSFLPGDQRASIGNNRKMPFVAHFSDRFRDVVKGRTSASEVAIRGYCSGATYLIETMKNCLCGSSTDVGMAAMFADPRNTVNYVECHDNMTCWDKIKDCCRDEDSSIHIAMQEMMIAAIFLAQGIPFLHSGQEFARTKHGKPNTYNDSDEINHLNYDRRRSYGHILECTKALIQIRKRYDCLRYDNREAVEQHVSFDTVDGKALVYKVRDEHDELIAMFNPTYDTLHYHFQDSYWRIYDNGECDEKILMMKAELRPYHTLIFVKAEDAVSR